MKFVLNCDSVSQLGTTINSYATELASTTSKISAPDLVSLLPLHKNILI